MTWSSCGTLEGLLRTIPATLVDAAAAERARSIVGRLPPVGGGVSLECRLDQLSPHADVVVRYGLPHASALQAWARGSATVENLVDLWCDPSSALAVAPYVDLEWDRGVPSSCPYATVMFDPALPEGLGAMRRAAHRAGPAPAWMRMRLLLEAHVELSPAVRAGVERCYAMLPRDAFIAHIGMLSRRHGRARDAVRLIVSIPHKPALADYLGALGRGASVDPIAAAYDRFCGQVSRIDLDLDVETTGVGPRLGLYSPFYGPTATDRAILRTLAALEEQRLLVGTKRRALLAWLGNPSHADAPERTLSLKVVLHEEGRTESKVYLSLLDPFSRESNTLLPL